MTISITRFCRIRSARFLLAVAGTLALHAAHAADCGPDRTVVISGDVPGAISYDVFVTVRPVVAGRLARLIAAQQVKMLHDGTIACEVSDDGVADPSAVLVRVPHGSMNYWVKRWDVKPVSGDAAGTL